MAQEIAIVRSSLRTPRAAAIAGIVFALLLGTAFVLLRIAVPESPSDASDWLDDPWRKNLGRVILLGLEVLIIADIIRTIVVDQTWENVAILGTIVLIRVVLSFSLEAEIDGVWPWNRWRVALATPAAEKS